MLDICGAYGNKYVYDPAAAIARNVNYDYYVLLDRNEDASGKSFWYIVHKRFWHLNHCVDGNQALDALALPPTCEPTMRDGQVVIELPADDAATMFRQFGFAVVTKDSEFQDCAICDVQGDMFLLSLVASSKEIVTAFRRLIGPDKKRKYRSEDAIVNRIEDWASRNKFHIEFTSKYGIAGGYWGMNISVMPKSLWETLPLFKEKVNVA